MIGMVGVHGSQDADAYGGPIDVGIAAARLQLMAAANWLTSAGASATVATSNSYRDVAGSGGYYYRQWRDGTIKILPGSKANAGFVYAKGSGAVWSAITNEITAMYGPFQPGNTIVGVPSAGPAPVVATGLVAPPPMPSMPVMTDPNAPPEEEHKGLPSWVTPVGVGVGVFAVLLVTGILLRKEHGRRFAKTYKGRP